MSAILGSVNGFSAAGLTAILNTLWLAIAVAGIVWIALRLMPRINAATRHAVWWAVLALIVLMPVATLVPRTAPAVVSAAQTESQVQAPVFATSAGSIAPGAPAAPTTRAARAVKPLVIAKSDANALPVTSGPLHAADSGAVAAPLFRFPVLRFPGPIEFHAGSWLLGLLFVWIGVCGVLLGRILRSYLHLRGLRNRARPASAELVARFERCLRESGTSRVPELLVSEEVISPLAAGFLCPVVILPDFLLEEIDEPELDYVLLHELAHVARRDDWTNLVGRLAFAAFVLHPVAAWILRRIEREREIACDDWVVAATGSAVDYAATLARMFEFCCTRRRELLATGMAHRSSNLGERIEMLLRPRLHFTARASLLRVGVCVAACLALLSFAVRMPGWIAFAKDATAASAYHPALPEVQISSGGVGLAATRAATHGARSAAIPQSTSADQDKTWRHEWKLTRDGSSSSEVRLSLVIRDDYGNDRMNSEDVPLSSLSGFSLSSLDHDGPVKFEYVRASGRVICEGTVSDGRGSGPFTVVLDPSFVSALEKIGYAAPRDDESFSLVTSDVTLDYARAVKDTGLTSSISDLIELQDHGVKSDYVRAVREEGFTNLSTPDICRLYDHGVKPDYLKAIKTADPKLSIEEVDRLYDHGVKPDYYQSMKAGAPQLSIEQIDSLYDHGIKPDSYKGFASVDPKLSIEEIDSLGDHGVKPEYYRSVKAADPSMSIEQIDSLYDHGVAPDSYKGFATADPKLSIEQIDSLRDHGVKPEYYQSMKSANPNVSIEQIDSLYDHGVKADAYKGFSSVDPKLSIEEIDSLRDHGVSPEYYQGFRAVDSTLSIEEINTLRDHGVEPEYLKEIRTLPDGFSISDISDLRDHGITAKYIRNLHEMGMKKLTAAQIIRLREGD